jgi:PAS domain S-box-containing protein
MDELSPEELRRHTQKLALATRAAGVGIWERDLTGRLTYWDRQMYVLRGLDPDRPPSADWLAQAAMRRGDYPEMMRLTQRHIELGEPYRREFRITRPDGTERWLASEGMVVRDADGRPLRMTGANWDITERRLAGSALVAKEAAERASRAKSEFMARMTHELRIPLNAVLGFSQLMLGDTQAALDGVQRDRLERVCSAGSRLLAVIEDILDVAAIEAGTLPLVMESVSLDALLDEVQRCFRRAESDHGIRLTVQPACGWVRADPKRLRQVLANLVDNAIKYNRADGSVHVAARQRTGRDGKAQWEIAVRDCGRGLTREQQRRMFEPFDRLGAERHDSEGAGIGLTVVRRLVEFMGGSLDTSSTPGQGTEVRVLLDAAQPPAMRSPSTAQPLPCAASAAPGPLSVVCIEDDPVNMLLVEQMVKMRPNISLRGAPDGRSGIELALADAPDVLLVDMHLPDMDGVEVVRRLRPRLAASRFVALTADTLRLSERTAHEAGFDAYWTKPIDLRRFLAGLDALAARRSAPAVVADALAEVHRLEEARSHG